MVIQRQSDVARVHHNWNPLPMVHDIQGPDNLGHDQVHHHHDEITAFDWV